MKIKVVFIAMSILCAIHAYGAEPASQSASKAPQVDRIVVVFKTHFDIGYTDMAVNVVKRYRTEMMDKALDLVDQTRSLPADRQFAWTLPGWPMKMILEDWPGQNPQRKQRILAACKEGRFVIHALPFTTHTELLEPEDLVRGMNFSSRIARELNLPLPRDGKMTDVPSHSWILPTMLKAAGVDFMHIGCNSASSSPEVPPLFWWEGPDGSRVLSMYAAGGYGTGHVPPKDWPHRTWLALIHTGDNHGPPTPDEVSKLFDKIKKDMPQAKVHIGRLSDFADAILAEKPELPVVRADMPDTWIHGPMSDPIGAKIARTIRPAMAAAEGLHANLKNWGVAVPDASASIATAYENSLLYGEHTWGGSLAWITPYKGNIKYLYGDAWKKERAEGRYKRSEDSWCEHTSYIEKTRDLIQPLLEGDLQKLADSVNVDGGRIVVYNPLAVNRSGYVSIPAGDHRFSGIKSVPDGETLPVEISGGRLGFVARDVPAMGYRTYVPVKADPAPTKLVADEKAATLDGPFFKLVLDTQKGTIRSFVDKRTGRELVDATAPHGFGQYLYERFDQDSVMAFHAAYIKIKSDWAMCEFAKPNMPSSAEVPYRAASPDNFTARYEHTPIAVRAILEAKAGSAVPCGVTTTITLYNELPYVDLEVTLQDKPADPWPEAGWICLPYKVDSPKFQLARLGSIIDPYKDTIAGTNHYLYGLNGGVAIVDPKGFDVGLCAIDHPLVSLGSPGCWKYSKQVPPAESRVYINLFNNQWTTNFRFWNEGTWSSRVRLWANEKYEPASSLATPSEQARSPMLAAWSDAKAGPLPAMRHGVRVGREGVLVTAFGANPDGGGTILRLWEQAGQSGPCRIELPEAMKTASVQPVTLRGEPQGSAVPVRDNAIEIDLKAFAPASLQIESVAKSETQPASARNVPPDVRVLRDLEYVKDGHERNRLDLYLPEKAARPIPVIVWVHGGGWRSGDKARCPAVPLTAKGYAIASMNYRFSRHAIFPAQIHDCKAAIRWLRAHAVEYGLDPDHIGVWGGSAGGHLVALLGTTAGVKDLEGPGGNEDQSSRVQAVVDWYGPTDLLTVGEKDTRTQLIGGDPQKNREKAANASPMTYVSKDAAPFLIMHGDKDKTVPISQSETFAEALKKAGVEATFLTIGGAGHGGGQFTSPENMKRIEDFFNRHLKSLSQQRSIECERDLEASKHMIPSLNHLPPDARKFLKLEFTRSAQGPVYLDLYLPAKAAGPLPLIVWVHGGGWHTNPTARNDFTPGRMVGRGYAMASIDYRDSKTAPFPAQIQDCKAAVRWLRAHAKEYGIDPQRFGAWGISAGGHLAAMLGVTGGEKDLEGTGGNAEFSSRVVCACDFCGPTDLFQMDTPETAGAKSALRAMAEDIVGGKPEDHRDIVAAINPATHADAGDPPMLIMHGDADPLVAFKQSEILYEAMKAKGAEVTFVVTRGGSHLFVGPEVDRTVDAFFDKHLKHTPPAANTTRH